MARILRRQGGMHLPRGAFSPANRGAYVRRHDSAVRTGAVQAGGVHPGFRRQFGSQRTEFYHGGGRGAVTGGRTEFRLQQGNGSAHGGCGAFRHQDFRQGSVLACLKLHVGLFRFDVGQVVSHFHKVSYFFDPSQDDAFVHGIGKAGHFNGNGHGE